MRAGSTVLLSHMPSLSASKGCSLSKHGCKRAVEAAWPSNEVANTCGLATETQLPAELSGGSS